MTAVFSFIGLVVLAAIAMGNALIQVSRIPGSMWLPDGERQVCNEGTGQGCPEPGCPSPFPGICEDS